MIKVHISKISAVHYFKLVFRSVLFIWALITYLTDSSLHHLTFANAEPKYLPLLIVVGIVFAIEMVLRFFPNKFESMGCQKQFKNSYIPTGKDPSQAVLNSKWTTFACAISWILLNAAIGAAYCFKTIDDGILILISLFFAVSDMICILFFCPFQSWIMKNRCCGTCRIYNWDYIMMFTPLIFARSVFTWGLAAMAVIILIRWEITVRKHPERFIEEYNSALKCVNCTEKLCSHKKQLHKLWEKQRDKLEHLGKSGKSEGT